MMWMLTTTFIPVNTACLATPGLGFLAKQTSNMTFESVILSIHTQALASGALVFTPTTSEILRQDGVAVGSPTVCVNSLSLTHVITN
jgi:hypothetical protein